MRTLFISLLTVLGILTVSAQDQVDESLSIDATINACIAMRDAVANNDSAAIKQSAKDLKAAGTTSFNSLRCKDDSIASLNGHLVFDEAFADSIAEGKDVYGKADDLTRSTAHKYTFASKGHQELAVVAEAGGLVTMKVHVTNSAGLDKRFDDTKNVKKGMPQRKTVFKLPSDRRNTVELEIINCGNKDCSFVVISN